MVRYGQYTVPSSFSSVIVGEHIWSDMVSIQYLVTCPGKAKLSPVGTCRKSICGSILSDFFLSFFRLPKACGSHYTKYCTQKSIYTPVGTPTPTAARSHYHCVSVKAVAFH